MKLIFTLFSILLSSLFLLSQSPAPYCPVSYSNVICNQPGPSNSPGNSINDFINSFSTVGAVNNIVNNNSGCNGNPNNYIRYNCNQYFLKVLPGQVITCNIQSGITFAQGFAVFIDWNQNNIFDVPAERVTSTPGVPVAGSMNNMTFTVPAGQATGQYRMRVRCAYATSGNTITPCQNYSHGETEDYEVFVNMDPLPIPGVISTNSTGVCPGQSATLVLQGHNGTIQWQSSTNPGGPWVNINGATTTPYTTPPINSTTCFRAALTACGQTIWTQPICITLSQLPSVSINSPTICQGDSVTLIPSVNPQGGTFLWSTGQTTGNITVSPSSTTQYTLTYNLGGCAQTSTTTVLVNPNPQVIISGDSSICQGETTTLFASQNNNYLWNTGEITDFINISPQVTTSYQVTVDNGNGCQSTATSTVFVHPLPQVQFVSDVVCNGFQTTLISQSALSQGTITGYIWSQGLVTIGNLDTITYIFPNAGTFPISLTVLTSENCVNMITQNVVVNANPVPDFESNILQGCSPLCITLSDFSLVANSQISSWMWSVDGVQISTLPNPNWCFNSEGQFDVSLTVTSLQGCSSTLTLNNYITVYPTPEAHFSITSDSIPIQDATLYFYNQSVNASSYLWNFGNGGQSTEFSPVYTFNNPGNFCIELISYGDSGCQDSEKKCIKVYQELIVYIPNTFTPNLDETNDQFKVKGTGIKLVQMDIFNRWGQQIFTSQGDISIGWSGKDNSGKLVKQDVYLYKIIVTDFIGLQHEFIGKVHLIR